MSIKKLLFLFDFDFYLFTEKYRLYSRDKIVIVRLLKNLDDKIYTILRNENNINVIFVNHKEYWFNFNFIKWSFGKI